MSPFEHVDDYPEIPVSIASTRTAIRTGAWRSVRPVLAERTAPCSAGCPAGIGIPAYLHDITAGRLDAAFAAITRRNPFPRITGRVCPHPCEGACNVAVAEDDAVSIRAVERWLGDATADLPHAEPMAPTGKRVAVVGAGPAGLAAAYYLRRSGHDVAVFDRRDQPGGMLRYGIPEYRLPRGIVDEETARLEKMGIEFHTGVSLGDDVTLDDLEHEFAAVFVATGAWRERPTGIHGESLLEPGLAFLEAAHQDEAVLPGQRCAVIGGGNTAIDVARTLRKLGADVAVLYRRTDAEMPAIREEYQRAVADGVTFEWLTLPRAVVKDGPALVATVEVMRLGEPDDSGRRRPEPTATFRELRFDAIFAATGENADLTPFPEHMKGDSGWLDLGADGATVEPLVFAAGDLATGPATVIEAIVAGRRAARAIDSKLGFGGRWPIEEATDPVGPAEVNPVYVPHHARAIEPGPSSTDAFAEDTTTLSAAATLGEIERCYSCGHCNECGTCFVFCPDGAITWEEGPIVDLEFCKGCGICVTECPGHAFVLVNERELTHA
jgi:NADPH-dependent glutamate synthase beta subunit-like oxidoreductase/Pyruvate/2-oxoacid:ferredoxin oxidoreductase delta subunit